MWACFNELVCSDRGGIQTLYFTLALSHIKKDLYIKNGTVERIVRPSVAPAAHCMSIATKLFPVLDLVLPCDCCDLGILHTPTVGHRSEG